MKKEFRKKTGAVLAGKWSRWTLGLAAAGLVSFPNGLLAQRGMEMIKVAKSDVELSGYVDFSAMWRFGDSSEAGTGEPFPDTVRSPGRLYDVVSKQNGFNLNAVSISLDKPLDEEAWSAGYHVQLLMGPDVALRNGFSLAGGGILDIGLNEAYVTLRTPPANGIEFRLGYFVSPLGYEVYDSHRNPNYSRSYGFYLEPKAHTGLTAKYEFTDWFSAMVGVANNYSPFIDARTPNPSSRTYLGVLTFTGAWFDQPELTLTLGYTGGHTATGAPTDRDPRIHNFYAGLHAPLPLEGLSVGLAYDYQANYAANVPAVFFFPAGPDSTYANAAALYVSYATGRLRFNTRVEYASGTAGNTILNNYDPFGSNKPMFGPNDNRFLGVTETIDYQLWENVLSRLEFRWDRDLAGGEPAFGSTANPRRNSFTVALNIVYRF